MMPDVTEAEKPKGLPIADRGLADFNAVGFGEVRRGHAVGRIDGNDGKVTLRSTTHDRAIERLAVGCLHGDRLRARDDMVRREHESRVVVDDAAPDRFAVPDLDDGRGDRAHDVLHDLGLARGGSTGDG